jgi:hypothetical protein
LAFAARIFSTRTSIFLFTGVDAFGIGIKLGKDNCVLKLNFDQKN